MFRHIVIGGDPMRAAYQLSLFALCAALAAPALADEGPSNDHPVLRKIASEINADKERETITKLVGFGTRATASDTKSDMRGIGAARRWVKAQFEAYSQACGGCLEIVTPSQVFTGERFAAPTAVEEVVAIQRGSTDPDRVVVISGHIDSRVTNVMNATSDAPGANDDGSGVAAVMEAARVLSKYKFPATIVYSVNSGEEQGLYGGKVIADYAKAHGWRVEADLNNDIIGNTTGLNGVHDDTHVRVFSEGTKSVETPAEAERRRYNGGELDSPSRNLARFIDGLAGRYVDGLQVTMIYRTDRYGRGGDQSPMLENGFPAVRLTEARENYDRQHQDVRVENGHAYGDVLSGVDFPYLAKVTRLNTVTLAALAWAPAPADDVKIKGAVSDDTTLAWSPAPGAAGYRVWTRPTIDPRWTQSWWAGDKTTLVLKDVIVDDAFFGVSAVSADGFESPVEFPGPAGSFFSTAPAAAAK
jgi:Zn-dependent M28 family amino/carboxypeptidase